MFPDSSPARSPWVCVADGIGPATTIVITNIERTFQNSQAPLAAFLAPFLPLHRLRFAPGCFQPPPSRPRTPYRSVLRALPGDARRRVALMAGQSPVTSASMPARRAAGVRLPRAQLRPGGREPPASPATHRNQARIGLYLRLTTTMPGDFALAHVPMTRPTAGSLALRCPITPHSPRRAPAGRRTALSPLPPCTPSGPPTTPRRRLARLPHAQGPPASPPRPPSAGARGRARHPSSAPPTQMVENGGVR